MKKLVSLIILLANTSLLHAQHVAIQLDKMNAVYLGVDNPLSVASDSYSCDQIVLKTDNGKLEKKDCDYSYFPEYTGVSEFKLYAKTKKGLKVIGGLTVRVKRLPDLVVSVGGKTSGYISQQELLRSLGPQCIMAGLDFDYPFRITTFTITISRPADSSVIFQHNVTNTHETGFDDETMTAFTHLKRNDIVEISNIHVSDPANIIRTMNSLVLKVLN